MDEKLAAIEALLFVHGEPLSFSRIEKILGFGSGESAAVLTELEKRLAREDRGLALVLHGESAQLVTHPRFGKLLEDFMKAELSEELTPASLEALAIISYFGPVSRSRIDFVRGVNSSFTVRNLLLRGLVERFSDPEHPNSFLYRPSFEFLRHLGLERQDKFPEYEKFRGLLAQFEAQTGNG